ncbi:hypothetical protein NPIL_631011 [Nephila pilipes]|uniref:Uncharacterized protein n=1 Tax=Nephila pilipes TaxID=299642 RepID=A0A8X6R7E1_NEPPI|nr:hypothetical protein NPIL_631011 [Nephila pilipes]
MSDKNEENSTGDKNYSGSRWLQRKWLIFSPVCSFTGGVSPKSEAGEGSLGWTVWVSLVCGPEDVSSAQSQIRVDSQVALQVALHRSFSRGMTQVQKAQTSKSGSAGAESQSSGLSNRVRVQANLRLSFQGSARSGQNLPMFATAQGGFDSGDFKRSCTATGSPSILTPPGTIPSQQQIGQPSSIEVTGSAKKIHQNCSFFPGSLTDRGIYGQDDRITADGRQITSSPTAVT